MNRRNALTALAGSSVALAAPNFAKVPRPSGEFGFELPTGKPLLLSQHRGKAVMLAFFSTTCPHCQDSARMMQRLQNVYGPRGFQAIGVCFNEMSKLLTPDFIRQQGLSFPVGYSTQDVVLNYLQYPAGEIPYVPMVLFIDKKGTIVSQHFSGADREFFKDPVTQEARSKSAIEKLLGVAAVAAKK